MISLPFQEIIISHKCNEQRLSSFWCSYSIIQYKWNWTTLSLELRGYNVESIWNWPSSIGSPSCSSIYLCISSSVIFPELIAIYPLAHKYLLQNCFLRLAYSCNKILELPPFKYCTNLLSASWGLYDKNMWTWSAATFPKTICTSCSMQICLSISLVLSAIPPVKHLFLYFGIHIRWTFKSYLLWLLLL